MKTLQTFLITSLFAIGISATTLAKPAAKHGVAYKIVEVDAVSITVSLGHSGEDHITYKIADKTKITLDGAPAKGGDLRAGMTAHIEVGSDKETAKSIAAQDPKANLRKGRAG
jgi:hypothetical protein